MKRLQVVVLGVVMIGLTACSSSQPEQAPSGTGVSIPAVADAPTSGSSDGAVSPAGEAPSLTLFAEAEAVFRAYWEADLEVSKSGGSDTLPPSVLRYVMGEFALEAETRYQYQKKNGYQMRDADQASIAWVLEAPLQPGDVITIDACVDMSKVQLKTNESEWAPGKIETSKFDLLRDTDGKLKLANGRRMATGPCP